MTEFAQDEMAKQLQLLEETLLDPVVRRDPARGSAGRRLCGVRLVGADVVAGGNPGSAGARRRVCGSTAGA
jgi:hypothetical protein